MTDQLNEIKARMDETRDALYKLTPEITQLRKKAYGSGATAGDQEALKHLEARAKQLLDELEKLANQMQQILGIPDEVLDEIEKIRIGGDKFDTIPRKNIANEKVASTGIIEKELPKAFESLRAVVDTHWLNEERAKKYRLDDTFLSKPLSITRGIRVESETLPVHRFAQSLLIAEDYLSEEALYDFYAGALCIPQLIALGLRMKELSEVVGPVQNRIESLWRGDSTFTDSLIYELVVAASCVRAGRKTELLEPTREKSPDLRIHDYPFPMVVECKRQKALTQYELGEEIVMQHLFAELYKEANRIGIRGSFNLVLEIEFELISTADIVTAAMRQRFAAEPAKPLKYDWGSIAFDELPHRIEGPLTKLYSPTLLKHLFSWDFDLPQYDGIICKVDTPESILVDYITNPVALLWTNNSAEAIRKRARTAISLFADATRQIPSGEVGIIYLCYQEGARESIADDRTKYFIEEISKWAHKANIRIPAFFLTRLVPRPLRDGVPDLIETGVRFLSDLYGDPSLFINFPTAVFTKN